MISLMEFRERRTSDSMTQSLIELSFYQLIEQYLALKGTLSEVMDSSYKREAAKYRAMLGDIKASEIMDEFIIGGRE